MREDDFIGQAFCWFTGVVENVNDPEKINRVKVRCHGYHHHSLETEHLPWATVMMPSTSQSSKGYGRTHELEKDSWVVGFFRDGMSAQDPLIMGSIATQTSEDKIIGYGAGESEGEIYTKEETTTDIPEETQDNYPDNKVYKSAAGHIVEFDNTDDKERIRIKHKIGTEVEINAEGDINVDGVDDATVTIHDNIEVKAFEGKILIQAYEDIDVTSITGDVNITARGGDLNITSAGASGKVTVTAKDYVKIQ